MSRFSFNLFKKNHGTQLHKPRHRPVIAIKCADLEYGAQFYFQLERVLANLCPTEYERPCIYMDIGQHVTQGSPLIDVHSKDNFDAVFTIKKKEPMEAGAQAIPADRKKLNASQFLAYMIILHNPHNKKELLEKLMNPDSVDDMAMLPESFLEFCQTQFTVQDHVKKPAASVIKPKHYFGIWGGMGPVAGASVLPEMVRGMKAEADKSPQGNAILADVGFAVYSNPAYSAPLGQKIAHFATNMYNVLKRAVSFLQKPVDAILITSNTMHTIYDRLQALSGGKCSNIVEEVTEGLAKENQSFSKPIVVLSTSRTRESKLYQKSFHDKGLEYVGTTDKEQAKLDKIITLVKNNKIVPAQEMLLALMKEIKTRTGAGDFLLACTELPIPVETAPDKFKAYTIRDSKKYLVHSVVQHHLKPAMEQPIAPAQQPPAAFGM